MHSYIYLYYITRINSPGDDFPIITFTFTEFGGDGAHRLRLGRHLPRWRRSGRDPTGRRWPAVSGATAGRSPKRLGTAVFESMIWGRWWCPNGDGNGSYLIIFAYAADNMNNSYMGMGQYHPIPIDTFLVGWTSIYQLVWGSLGTRVLTHPHMDKTNHLVDIQLGKRPITTCRQVTPVEMMGTLW